MNINMEYKHTVYPHPSCEGWGRQYITYPQIGYSKILVNSANIQL